MSEHPKWIRVRAPSASEAAGIRAVRDLLQKYRLTTVCQGAICPNAVECWGARTATFMLLGDVCTRACRFCGVQTGDPGGAIDSGEPERLADAVGELGLRYAVLTSVDRDDLPDGGAGLFAAAIDRLKESVPGLLVEVLIPDFQGRHSSLDRLLETGADVFGHNVETVRRLTPSMRDLRAGYEQSLAVLAYLSQRKGARRIKSGVMLGLGETHDDILETLHDLRDAGVDILTIGQYLRPTEAAVRVARYVPPEEFDEIAAVAKEIGFGSVVAGPLVRSSYHALEAYLEACDS